ncbi:hypothetical protein [Lysinibacillus sp. 54212]
MEVIVYAALSLTFITLSMGYSQDSKMKKLEKRIEELEKINEIK